MSFRKIETANNSAQQVQQYLDAALRLTAEMDVPDDLRVVFFEKAVDLCSAKSIALEQVAATAINLDQLVKK